MLSDRQMAVELDAALAVIEWKREFARRLRREATRIARSSDAVVLRVEHYRRALPAAMQSTLSFVAKSLDQEQENGVGRRVA